MDDGRPASEPHHGAGDRQEHDDAAQREATPDELHAAAAAGRASPAAPDEPSGAEDALRENRTTRRAGILSDASERDAKADSRDEIADDRDRAASLQSFLHHEEYDAGNKARRAAAMDRSDSKDDRAAAADDRSELAGNGLDDGLDN
jgi:hypothetical protein